LHLPLLLAPWTGQAARRSLAASVGRPMTGRSSGIRPHKSLSRRRPRGKAVTVLVGAPLKAALDAAPRKSPIILLTAASQACESKGLQRKA
jgi:hypothetical protein